MKETQAQKEFMQLYQPIHAEFERFCRARVYGEMEYTDLMNETLLTAFRKKDSLKDEKAFLSFLMSIAVRKLSNAHRKQRTQRMEESQVESLEATSAPTDRRAEVARLHEALNTLPPKQRECIILFELNGFSIKEICAIQKSRESAVKQRLRRARIALHACLSDRISLAQHTHG